MHRKHPKSAKECSFRPVFETREELATSFGQTTVVIDPNLVNVILNPPTLAEVGSIIEIHNTEWGVYLIHLIHPDQSDWARMYVGSGTNVRESLTARMKNYKSLTTLPYYVQKNIKEGYIIEHSSILTIRNGRRCMTVSRFD